MKNIYIIIAIMTLPFLGKAEDMTMDFILGKENAQLVSFQMELSTNKEQVNYIQNVGMRLITELDERLYHYQFHLVNDETPNSFSLPAGYVYITTGLLPLLQNEDELAYILAHEIIHIKNRHYVKQLEKGVIPDVVPIPGNLLTSAHRKLGTIVNAPINKYEAIIFHTYGKSFEYKADVESIELLAKAGYNPNVMESVLNRISKALEISPDQIKEKSFFAEHPSPDERLHKVSKTLLALDYNQKLSVSNEFFACFDGVMLGQDPNNGVLINNQYLNPIFNFSVEFPESWSSIHDKSDVGAYDEKNKTAILLTLDDCSITPQAAADQFVQRLHKRCKSRLKKVGTYSIHGEDAYRVSFECKSNGEMLQASIIWASLDDKLVRLVGVYPEYMSKHMDNTAQSLRSLTTSEMLAFNAKHFQIVKAQNGESLEELNLRMGNKLDLEMTALINAKDKKQPLNGGESVKIVLEIDYGFDYQDNIDENDFRHSIVSL